MATVVSTLYPPVVETFMPAFPKGGPAPITFSLSPYNSNLDISKLHVSVVDQRTNQNVLVPTILKTQSPEIYNTMKVINGVLIMNFANIEGTLSIDTETNICTFYLPKALLKSGEDFVTSNYYKVQFRFDSSSRAFAQIDEDYLSSYRGYFSEWSSVCLIKAIPNVEIVLNNFDQMAFSTSDTRQILTFPAGLIPITGQVIFDNGESSSVNGQSIQTSSDNETLSSYEISIVNEATDEEVDNSGTIYTYNNIDPNSISWLAGLENEEAGNTYNVIIKATTKNQYTFSKTYTFKISALSPVTFNPIWTYNTVVLNSYGDTDSSYVVTEEDGMVNFTIKAEGLPPGFLYVKRATSLDNFKKWELLSCTQENNSISRSFTDATVGSLVRYRYSCQYRVKHGGLWTNTVKSAEIVYPDFYDILLMRQDKQLAIRYNENIQSITPTVNRQVINTLGGKYPKFAENANMNYKKFSISGIITAESDFNRKFLDDTDYTNDMLAYDSNMDGQYIIRNDTITDGTRTYLTQSSTAVYSNRYASAKNTNHDLYPINNWWWERKFREEALTWLNDGEPKLFRSMTEGNICVMLTDVSLTPNKQVGRRTYNFTATAYEIGDGYSLDTLTDLGIITVPNEYSETSEDIASTTITKVGQMPARKATASTVTNTDYLDTVYFSRDGEKPKVTEYTIDDFYTGLFYQGALSDFLVVKNTYELKDVRIQFESRPQWYLLDNQITLVEDPERLTTSEKNMMALGYKISVTLQNQIEKYIFVNERGYYQLPSNLITTELRLYDGATATIDYKLSYQIQYNESSISLSKDIVKIVMGQLNGRWKPSTALKKLIATKYQYIRKSSSGYKGVGSIQEFDSWTGFSFDGTPYTTLGIQHNDENLITSDYIVGRTGVFNLMSENYDFREIVIKGRRMFKHEYSELKRNTQKYELAEWEYFLDDSVTDVSKRQSEYENPQYNRIYGFLDGSFKIYYLDEGWYDLEFLNTDKTMILAKVPVYGMINYRGVLTKTVYSND